LLDPLDLPLLPRPSLSFISSVSVETKSSQRFRALSKASWLPAVILTKIVSKTPSMIARIEQLID